MAQVQVVQAAAQRLDDWFFERVGGGPSPGGGDRGHAGAPAADLDSRAGDPVNPGGRRPERPGQAATGYGRVGGVVGGTQRQAGGAGGLELQGQDQRAGHDQDGRPDLDHELVPVGFSCPVVPGGPVQQQRAAVEVEGGDLDHDDDAGRGQGRGEDEGQGAVEQAHSRFLPLPDPARRGDVGGQIGNGDVDFVDVQPGQLPDPVADVAADLPGDLRNGCGPADT